MGTTHTPNRWRTNLGATPDLLTHCNANSSSLIGRSPTATNTPPRGSQYASIRYTDRLIEAGAQPMRSGAGREPEPPLVAAAMIRRMVPRTPRAIPQPRRRRGGG
jgi:hypothetical protein